MRKNIEIEIDELDICAESKEQMITRFLKKHKYLSTNQVAEILDVAPKAAHYQLTNLVRDGYVKVERKTVRMMVGNSKRRLEINVWSLP